MSSTGEEGDEWSGAECLSPDGRFVAFPSQAANLVTGDTNGVVDIFVHDRQTGTTERVSVSTTGEEGNSSSSSPALSADGRFVAFTSVATNLVPGDTNGVRDILVHDRQTGTTERVNVSSAGEQADAQSEYVGISADGRFVAFSSGASNLVSGDTNGVFDIFVHDRQTGATERVSVSGSGEQANGESFCGRAISADGRFVAFDSSASNLVPGDTNGVWDVFVHDRQTGATERVSVSSTGVQKDDESSVMACDISADGRFVAFTSFAANLVADDTNDTWDAFVHDRQTGATERVSVNSAGEEGDQMSEHPRLSADGRLVTFCSLAANLVPDDTNNSVDVFVRDRQTGAVERVSVDSTGEQADPGSVGPGSITADGRFVLFDALGSDLVPGDTNAASDAFVRTRYGFRDVFSSFWAYGQIMACVEAAIVGGYGDATYQPATQVTRDQMAVFVSRSIATPTGEMSLDDYVPPTTPSFSDVPTDFWCYEHIEYAVEHSIVGGYEDGTYQPELPLDRGQMAVFIARAMAGDEESVPDPVGDPSFPDVPADFWSYRHIEYIAGEEVAGGYYDGLYHPEYPVTRDQMAVFICRAFDLPT